MREREERVRAVVSADNAGVAVAPGAVGADLAVPVGGIRKDVAYLAKCTSQ